MYDLINAPLPKLPKSVKLAVKAKEECLMKKSVILCMVAFVLISVFVGCSVKNSDVNENAETSSFSASKETTLPISTAENDTKADTTNTATVNTKENANVNSSEKTSGVEIDKTAKASTNKPISPNTKADKTVQTYKAKSTPNSTSIKPTEKQTTKKVTTTSKSTTTKKHTTQKSFDVNHCVSYAKNYAKSIGLNLDSSCTDCWDNPINANANCSNIERDIKSRLNRYKNVEGFTDVWIWAESTGNGNYDIYIGYA